MLYRLTPIGSDKVDGFAEYEDANQVGTVVHLKVGVFVRQVRAPIRNHQPAERSGNVIVSTQYNTREALVQRHRKVLRV